MEEHNRPKHDLVLEGENGADMERRCTFWLPRKNRYCANSRFKDSLFCGNHNSRPEGQWIPCPLDPSHLVLKQNVERHVKRCPMLKQVQSLSLQPFYRKGINAGREDEETLSVRDSISPKPLTVPLDNVSSEMKRDIVHNMSVLEFSNLVGKIESVYESFSNDIQDSYRIPEACSRWIKCAVEERKLPFQEKHVMQQASILGNLEIFGVLKSSLGRKPFECKEEEDVVPAVIEFGAGRGYLTQMLADCYGIKRVFLVERKSYKLKADRSLRQNEDLMLERLRIDIEDLDLNAVEPLEGVPFLAIGKHLCGAATDLALRCCFPEKNDQYDANKNFGGLAIATCCHHLCQWKHYTNKKYFLDLGITKDQFHAITWFTSWAVDANHGSEISDNTDCASNLLSIDRENGDQQASGAGKILTDMKPCERAALGFKCKRIIDMGRLLWLRKRGLNTLLVRYVPSTISPENYLLIAKPHTRM
ncbi:hypothetical protein K1719_024770 [Acacia pycnantha]|nr:hypothetical protein K1719_024770 [Acacia pycnantha]